VLFCQSREMDHTGTVQASFSSIGGTRKEKKKQVKDELDRLRQAEKKRRRLEKALATSAAIRTELEKKKQKKKEEQQRLDEEGAAIAEAVALHVLVDEDSEETSKVILNVDEKAGLEQCPYVGLMPGNSTTAARNIELCLIAQKKELYWNSIKCFGDINYSQGSGGRERISGSKEAAWQKYDWKVPHCRAIGRTIRDSSEIYGRELVFGDGWSQWQNVCMVDEKRITSDHRARAAEMSAGLAAAQAVAALQIAEEARAEAKAAKLAAEAAINRILDKKYLVEKFDFVDKCKTQSRSANERDLPSTQHQEIDLKRRDKTLHV